MVGRISFHIILLSNRGFCLDAGIGVPGGVLGDLEPCRLRFIVVEMNLELFEHPYCDSAYAAETVWSEAANEYGIQTETKSIVMLKNDGTEIWTPASIRYGEYTADSEYVRQESLGGLVTTTPIYDNYGSIITEHKEKENRPYYGQTVGGFRPR